MTVNHHEHDKIVELCRVPGRLEADVIAAKLQDAGVTASVNYGDGGGYFRGVSVLGGHQVLVFDCDLERAHAVLEQHGAPTGDAAPVAAPPPPRPSPTGRGRHRY